MPSSYTSSLRFEQQFTGENINLWGIKLNNALARIDDSIAGFVAIALTGNYALTSANDNATADEARRAHLKFTGALAAGATITLPNVPKSYWIWNATNKTLTFSLGSGTTVSVESGDKLPIWSDGTGVNTLSFGPYNLKDYIGTISSGGSGVPGLAGNAGKFLYTDETSAFWKAPATTDLSDYLTEIIGKQVALAVAL